MKYSKVLSKLISLTNRNISQAEIARIMEVERQAINKRALRDSNFSDEEIETLEKAFNVCLADDDYRAHKKLTQAYKELGDYLEVSDDCVAIEHIHIKPSCGKGTIILDEPEITPVRLGKELIRSIFRVSDPTQLKTFTASGDSMEDGICDGDILLIDSGRTDYNNGGIFILTIDNEWFIKRLHLKITGELDIISDNPKYPKETLKPNTDVEIVIHGKVIRNLSKGL